MKKKAFNIFTKITGAVLLIGSLLLIWVGVSGGWVFLLIAVLMLFSPRFVNWDKKVTPGAYNPEHREYIKLRCPYCGAITVTPDFRGAIPGCHVLTKDAALDAVGAAWLEEIDLEYDADADMDDAAYCPACRCFFNPGEVYK